MINVFQSMHDKMIIKEKLINFQSNQFADSAWGKNEILNAWHFN